jgi:hypothetical protein
MLLLFQRQWRMPCTSEERRYSSQMPSLVRGMSDVRCTWYHSFCRREFEGTGEGSLNRGPGGEAPRKKEQGDSNRGRGGEAPRKRISIVP